MLFATNAKRDTIRNRIAVPATNPSTRPIWIPCWAATKPVIGSVAKEDAIFSRPATETADRRAALLARLLGRPVRLSDQIAAMGTAFDTQQSQSAGRGVRQAAIAEDAFAAPSLHSLFLKLC